MARNVESLSSEAAAVGPADAPLADPVDVLDSTTAGSRVIRGSAVRFAGYALSVLLSVGSASLMIRHLGLTDWGRYVTVSSLVMVVTGLSELGMSNVGLREYATLEPRVRTRLLQNLLGIRLVLTVVGIAAAVVFGAVAGYPSAVVAGTAVAGVGLLLTVAQQTVGIPLAATLAFGWLTTLDVIRQVATLAAAAALVVAGARLLPFLGISIPVGVLVLALTLFLVRGGAGLRPRFERGEWGRIVRLTIAYALAAAVGTLYVSATVIVTSLVGTAHETGYYGASFRIFTVVGNVAFLLVGSAFPVLSRAARDDAERLQYAAARLWEISLMVGAWFALVVAAAAPFVLHVIAGATFGPAVPVLRIQAAALLGGFLAVALAHVLLSLRRHRALLVANAVGLSLSIALTLVLVPPFGAKGAAAATVAGEFCLAAGYLVALTRTGVRVPSRIVPYVAAAAAAASALAFVPGLDNVGLAAAASGVYAIVLVASRAVPVEVFRAFGLRREAV